MSGLERRVKRLAHRLAQQVDLQVTAELEARFDLLEQALPLDIYEQALNAIADAPDELPDPPMPTVAATLAVELERFRELLRLVLPEAWVETAIAAIGD